MLDFCIIGSGVSGSTIAYLLSKKYSVHILDKARGPGGRASNKRFKQNLSFDHGVQYISPKSKEFIKFIKTLCKKKEAKIWTGNHLDFTFEKKEISEKFIGMKGNNFISKFYTKKIKKIFKSSVKSIFSMGDAKNCLIFFKLYLTKSLLAFLPIYFFEKGFFSKVKSR